MRRLGFFRFRLAPFALHLIFYFSAVSANNFFLIKKAAAIAQKVGIKITINAITGLFATNPDSALTTVNLTAH